MSSQNQQLCRVALSVGGVNIDLALPAGVPVAELVPNIVDLLAAEGYRHCLSPTIAAYRLFRPGGPALNGSKSLAQHAITNGTLLTLASAAGEVPTPRFDDPAEQVAATIRAGSTPWSRQAARATSMATAAILAAIAGFVAVPGGPGAPNLLLATAAATTIAALALHLGGAGPTPTALCCLATLGAAAALVAVLGGIPLQSVSAVTAPTALALLRVAGRLSLMINGIGRLPEDQSADLKDVTIRAHQQLTGLVAGLAATATLAMLGTLASTTINRAPPWGVIALATALGAALLLQARSHTDRSQIMALVGGSVVTVGGALVTAAAAMSTHSPWLGAAVAVISGAAMYLGCGPAPSPAAARMVELLEYPVLIAVAPLTVWACGCYASIRGLRLV